MRVLIVLCFAAACGPGYYRYTRSVLPPMQARQEVADRAVASGHTVKPSRNESIQIETVPDPAREPDPHALHEAHVRATAAGAGSIVEVSGSTRTLVEALGAGPTYHADAFSSDPLVSNVQLDVGVAHSPGAPGFLRIDAGGQFGRRVSSLPSRPPGVFLRRRVSVFGGIGLSVDDSEPRMRYELGVLLDAQRVVTVVQDRPIAQGPRRALSLSLATLRGERDALEISATVHFPPYGGGFVRSGYEWGPHRDGATYMAGVRLDVVPAAVVVGLAAATALGLAIGNRDWTLEDLVQVFGPRGDPNHP
ncbi:MAG: hypothetical protein ACKV2T_21815 [Kofleriaceae bacterium]